jgi:hypothetical protein
MRSKNRGWCAAIVLSLAAILCVCGACMLAALGPPMLGMPVPIPHALPLGVQMDDNFSSKQDSEKNGWAFTSAPYTAVTWSPGKLTQLVTGKEQTYTSWAGSTYRDVAVEVEAQPTSDPSVVSVAYGITFGLDEKTMQTMYNFTVTPRGEYFLRKWVGGKVVVPMLVDVTLSAYILPRPSSNRLGVITEGSRISLYINGKLVQTITDDSYRGGKVGVCTSNSGDKAQTDFTHVRVMSPLRAKLEWGTQLVQEPRPPSDILFDDDFSSELASRDKGWAWSKEDSNNAKIIWSPHKVSIVVTSQYYTELSSPAGRKLTDFAVEIQAAPSNDPGIQAAQYGIAFRISGEQNRDFYRFGISTSGQYHLFKVIDGKTVEPYLVDFTPSVYIKPRPSENQLGVLVEGANISLYINGNLVKTVVDDSIKSGYAGIFADSTWAPETQVDFSRVTVYTIAKARAQWSTQLAVEPTPPADILFQDDFASQQASADKGWYFGTSGNVDSLWSPNKYTLVAKQKNLIHSSLLPLVYSDLGVEVEMQADSINPRTEYGIVFRSNGKEGGMANNYRFGVMSLDNGKTYDYYLLKEVDGQTPEPWLVDVRPAPGILPGTAQNRLGVLAEGSTISLYINGQRVRTVTDDPATSGKVGVFVHTIDDQQAKVSFTHVTIYTVAKAKAEWQVPVVTSGILYEGDFSSQQKAEDDGWDFTPAEGTDFLWSPNQLTIQTKTKGQLNGPYYTRFKDFGMEVETQTDDQSQLVYGLYFRKAVGKSSYYAFYVTPAGEYYLIKLIDGKAVVPYLVDLTPSSFLKKGASKNRLGVLAEGARISLFINGNLVKTVVDDTLPYGYGGVFALPTGNTPAHVDFDRFIVYTVEQARKVWNVPTMLVTEPTRQPGILFQDDFSSKEQTALKWNMQPSSSADRIWSPNMLTLAFRKPKGSDMDMPVYDFDNFGVELEVQSEDKPGIQYGIVFRHSVNLGRSNFYLFAASNQGAYSLLKEINDEWSTPDPVPSDASAFLKRGSSKNRFGVLVDGTRISLYINGNLVKTITDASLSNGRVGIFGYSGSNEGAQVSVSRFTVYTVERAKTELSKK